MSWAFHVSDSSYQMEELPMGKNKREPVHESYEMASGPIAYNMTNDYMCKFRPIGVRLSLETV